MIHDVDKNFVEAHDLRVFVVIGDKPHEVFKHLGIRTSLLDQDHCLLENRIGMLHHQLVKIFLQFIMEYRGSDQPVVSQIHVIPVVSFEVAVPIG